MSDVLHSILEPARFGLRITALPRLAVVAAHGADAVSFLHSQLSQDVQGLSESQASLAGYCTAKGRLLATLVMWQVQSAPETPEIRMLMRADIAQSLIKRLSMFVLRAKVKFALVPVTVSGVSLAREQAEALEQELGFALPAETWQRVSGAHGDWIAAPCTDPTRRRVWRLVDAAVLGDAAKPEEGSDAAWAAEDIAAGLPWISAATQDLFIPQTVNLDLLGGVSFTKGCYPGQEVVARSHYRGVIKRRMVGGMIDSADASLSVVAPGTDVFEVGRDAPCGRVVDAVAVEGRFHLLFEAPFQAVDAGSLRLGAPDGSVIKPVALPYPTRT